MHECTNVFMSSCFPENGNSDVIFGSLKDQVKGVDGRGTQDEDTCGGGSGREPEGQGGKY